VPTTMEPNPHHTQLAQNDRGYNEETTYPAHDVQAAHAEHPHTEPPMLPPARLSRGFWIGLFLALVVLALIIIYGIHARSADTSALVTQTKAEATPEVRVTYPTGGDSSNGLTLPGNTQAYVDTPIYSRTNGYLKKWFFDIGAHVRKGQLMATIETPELDQQLQVAEADLKAAQANENLAKITSARYQNLLKSNSVSKQETDEAIGGAEAKEAAMEASMAGVRRLQQLQGFERVYAPFSGVVTQRNTDIGDLITGGTGSGSAASSLFHLAAVDELRVFVSVPEIYSSLVRDGSTATLTLDEYPGQVFHGIIARNSNTIDPQTRTLNVEVDVPNPGGKLLPGAYVKVHFNIPSSGNDLTLPSNTIIFRAHGTEVGVVRNGKVLLTPITIAADHGATVEIGSGVDRSDAVILDPSDSLSTGEAVKIAGGASK
jgi:RND family efflux transporter MFP subunit